MSAPTILHLATKSLLNRRLTAGLTVFAIAVSVFLVLAVEKVRVEARASFADTISGTDLIVGARSGAIQLLLYSVFRIGNATNTVSWRSYLDLAKREDIAWTIPMSLGDSHKGFRVLGTTTAYFDHFRYGRRTPLEIEIGKRFDDVFDAVLGAEVARTLGYTLGQSITISHGIGSGGLVGHDDKPFTVVGILERTGTPVDRTVHVSLEGIEAIHVDWRKGAKVPGMTITADEVREMDLTPATITAVLVGLKSRLAIFRAQREISRYRREPLSAILPGVALEELWGLTRVAETALGIISVFVVAAGLLGMMTMVFASLGERRREMAILRSVGARPGHVLGLFVAESAALTVAGAAFGVALLYGAILAGRPFVEAQFGLFLPLSPPSETDLTILAAILAAGTLAGLPPAILAYRRSLADGMTVRT